VPRSQLLVRQTGEAIDNANHNLIHTLSVRLDARWHDRDYPADTECPGCKALFDRLKEIDTEAVRLLTAELARHVQSGKFPLDLAD